MKNQIAALMLAGTLLLTGCGDSAQLDTAMENIGSRAVRNPITREQAQAIALEHAGLTSGQVTHLRTEYEVDDGVPRFEVQFRQDRWEYDYEINANTGEILSWDRDT